MLISHRVHHNYEVAPTNYHEIAQRSPNGQWPIRVDIWKRRNDNYESGWAPLPREVIRICDDLSIFYQLSKKRVAYTDQSQFHTTPTVALELTRFHSPTWRFLFSSAITEKLRSAFPLASCCFTNHPISFFSLGFLQFLSEFLMHSPEVFFILLFSVWLLRKSPPTAYPVETKQGVVLE